MTAEEMLDDWLRVVEFSLPAAGSAPSPVKIAILAAMERYAEARVAAVVALLREPDKELLDKAAIATFGSQYDDDDSRETFAERGRYGPDRSERRETITRAFCALADALEKRG